MGAALSLSSYTILRTSAIIVPTVTQRFAGYQEFEMVAAPILIREEEVG